MDKRLLDTNIFLRYFLQDNLDQHEIAKNIITKGEENKVKLFSDSNVIAEINNVLKHLYELDKMQRVEFLQDTLSLDFVNYLDKKPVLAQALTYFSQHNLDFEDCLLLAKAKGGYTLTSFDTKLKTVAKTLNIKRIP